MTSFSEKLPVFTEKSTPLDPKWADRLREELVAMINLVEALADKDNDWFTIEPIDDEGLHWEGSCWVMYDMRKYTFKVQFEIPATYPSTPIEIQLPELDGKTEKMHGPPLCPLVENQCSEIRDRACNMSSVGPLARCGDPVSGRGRIHPT